MNSTYLFRNDLLRRGSRESDQKKRPLRLRFVVVIGGAGFISAVELAGRYWRERMARKDESRFTISL